MVEAGSYGSSLELWERLGVMGVVWSYGSSLELWERLGVMEEVESYG